MVIRKASQTNNVILTHILCKYFSGRRNAERNMREKLRLRVSKEEESEGTQKEKL